MTDNMTQDRLKEVANTINQELEKDENHDKNKRDRKHRQQEQQKSGYSFDDGNGNGKGGPKQKSEKEEKKKFEYIQKYSNDRLLAEAVIIEGKPCFAVVSTKDGRIIYILGYICWRDSSNDRSYVVSIYT
ncbi:MAG: hypothetical protein WA941_23365 [Nitrososphaeraceae archaeon]